jgi:hypothetical protein
MMKRILTIGFALACFTGAKAQTLRIRSNSLENLHIVAEGTDKDGHVITSGVLYDFYQNDYKVLSLFKEKYGFDRFHNKEMQHEGADPTAKWTKLVIYDASNRIYDTIDLTKETKKSHIAHANIWAKVKIRYDRDYVITDVVINDDDV